MRFASLPALGGLRVRQDWEKKKNLNDFKENVAIDYAISQRAEAGHWWLTPRILAEIGSIVVQDQPGKQFTRPHFQNNQEDWRHGSRGIVLALQA
jgi:hypothetical protein